MYEAYNEIIEKIRSGTIRNRKQLEIEKIGISKKYNLRKIIKNSELIKIANDLHILKLLKIKPVRTLSGISSIAVMWIGDSGFSCPYSCIYCPTTKNIPKSYSGKEPPTLRAIKNNYDPFLQTRARILQYKSIGHPTNKIELIILGGTFLAWQNEKQEIFVKRCFDAMNEFDSKTLLESQKFNENADNKCIGLTIETRPDYCSEKHIHQMLKLGCTRTELGIQTTSDELLKKAGRGHGTKESISAIKNLKNAGLKFCAHWMPGLTGLNGRIDTDREIETFAELFTENYQPDELKIYPVLVLSDTKLYELWKNGRYDALNEKNTLEILTRIKKIVPRYVRIKRIMRDIPENIPEAGASMVNLRQIMHEKGIQCKCIRCREIGMKNISENIQMNTITYNASGGKEFFISFDDMDNDKLLGFLRLRINNNVGKVREMHVYGTQARIGEKGNIQHKGIGKAMLEKAEVITKEFCNKIQVTSGIGARNYYRKLG